MEAVTGHAGRLDRRRPMGGDLLRYGLWLAVLATAEANRRYYGLPSTWAFHAAGNTITLLLPELLGGLDLALHLEERAAAAGEPAPTLRRALRAVVVDNPQYSLYAAPLALAYVVSHPRFNIYKGDLGALQLAGFGLDTLPHAATAASLTWGLLDAIDALAAAAVTGSPLASLARAARRRGVAVSGLTLATLTLAYELAEWSIHRSELRATGGDASRINMEWSLPDTVTDVCSNVIGWLLALLLRQTK